MQGLLLHPMVVKGIDQPSLELYNITISCNHTIPSVMDSNATWKWQKMIPEQFIWLNPNRFDPNFVCFKQTLSPNPKNLNPQKLNLNKS